MSTRKERYYNAYYMAVTADRYELPVAVFDNIREASAWSGMSESSIRSIISRHCVHRHGPAAGCRMIAVKAAPAEEEIT